MFNDSLHYKCFLRRTLLFIKHIILQNEKKTKENIRLTHFFYKTFIKYFSLLCVLNGLYYNLEIFREKTNVISPISNSLCLKTFPMLNNCSMHLYGEA